MRRISLAIVAALGALAPAGCGSDEPPETPAACLVPASDYLAALEAAPGEVRLGDETPISSCLVEEQQPGALGEVGGSMVEAATTLNRAARERPQGEQTVALGYLVGAAEQAAETTGGIHADLVLRLNAAARYSGPGDAASLGAGFERAFGEGYAAAQSAGD